MAGPREILKRGLDAAGFVVTGLPAAVNPSDAVPLSQIQSLDAAVASTAAGALAVEIAARIAGDLAHPGTITALTGDVTASGTGSVAAALANIPQAVLLTRLAALTSDPAFNSHKLTALADGTTAHDATTLQQLFGLASTVPNAATMVATDVSAMTFAIRRVDTYKDFFFLKVSTDVVATPHEVFATADATKWWVRMYVKDPYWAIQPVWFVDPISGNDENEGTTAGAGNAIQTRTEYARRTDDTQLVSNVVVNITSDLLATDTRLPHRWQTSVAAGGSSGFKIRYQGTKIALFTGTLGGVVNRVGSTGTVTKLTLPSLPTSWTASGLVDKIIEGVNSSGQLVSAVVVADLGSKTAWVSPPEKSGFVGEDTFADLTSVTIYDGVNLSPGGSPTVQTVGYQYSEFDYCKAARWETTGNYVNFTNCFGAVNHHGNIINALGCRMDIGAQSGWAFIYGGYGNHSATSGVELSYIFPATQKGALFNSGNVAAKADVECNVATAPVVRIIQPGATAAFGGFVYGTLSSGTNVVQFDTGVRNCLVQFKAVPAFGGAAGVNFVEAGVVASTATLSSAQLDDGLNNRVIGPAGPTLNDNRSQPIAHLGSGGATTTSAANIGDALAIAALAVAGGAGSPAITSLTTDVAATGPGAAAATIQPNAVTNTKLADMATARFKGRATAGTGDPEDLTGTQATTLLDVVATATKGLAPASGGGTANFLRADGTWTAPPGTAGAAVTSLTGDVTGTGPGATPATIANDAVTNAKAANMPAHTFKANNTGSTADPLDITGTQATAELDVFDPTHKGLAPSSGGGTSNYLRADGTWATPAGTGGGGPLTGLSGDVTTTGGGVAPATISNDAVSFAKMQNIPTQTLIGRQTAATGDPESIGVTGGVEFDGSGNLRVGAFTGDVSKSAGSAGTVINPGVVTNAQLANVPTGTVKGRTLAGIGVPTDLTFAALKTAIAISFVDISGTLSAAQFPALTGDITTTAGSFVTTLAATGVTAGTFGDGSHSLTIQVDAKGRVLAITAPSISISAGAVAGLSTTQTGALTGDVTKPAGSGATTLANIPDATPVAGRLRGTGIAAPGSNPPSGKGDLWYDVTQKIWKNRDDAGLLTHMVRAQPAFAHNFITEIKDDGTVSIAQPGFADLSGTITAPQIQVPANTVLGNNTGITADVLALSPAQLRTMLGLDTPRHFDLLLSYGTGDGTNSECITPQSFGPGNWPFFLLPHSTNKDHPNNPYVGGNHDANLTDTTEINNWPVQGTFTHGELSVSCAHIDGLAIGGSVVFILVHSGTVDSSPLSVTITAGGNAGSGVVSLGAFSFAPGDNVGVRCQVLGGGSGAHLKTTVSLRLTP